jgi:hypothetical protein
METKQLVLEWEKPFKLTEPTPPEANAIVGLYAVVFDSEIIYVGKAECQGTLAEARSHNFYERRLKKAGKSWNKKQALVYIGTVPQDQPADCIDDAENLTIFRLQPECNIQKRSRYKGRIPFKVINEGNRPPSLRYSLQYP